MVLPAPLFAFLCNRLVFVFHAAFFAHEHLLAFFNLFYHTIYIAGGIYKIMEAKRYFLVFFPLLFFSFLLNFIWESIHAVYLYEGHSSFAAEMYVSMVIYASSVDASLILAIYLIVAIFFQNVLWLRKISRSHLVLFSVSGIIIAAFIEYRAVFIFDKWAYSELMPTIFGIGLSPLIQLAVTGMLAVYLAGIFGKDFKV